MRQLKINAVEAINRSKNLKRGIVSLFGLLFCTEYLFRVDPLSYILFPIEQVAAFPLYDKATATWSDRAPRSLKFSEDGRSVFVSRKVQNEAIAPDSLMQWNIEKEEMEWAYDPYPDSPYLDNFALSADQSRFVIPEFRNTVQIRDGKTGKVRAVLSNADAVMSQPTLSPDGSMLVGRSNNQLKIWDTQTGELKHVLDTYGAFSFSPSGDSLAIAQGTTLEVWNTASGTKRYTTQLSNRSVPFGGSNSGDGVMAVHFSTDELLITVQRERCRVQQIETATGEVIRETDTRKQAINSGAPASTVTPDGKTLTCYLLTGISSSHDLNPGEHVDLEFVDIETGDRVGYVESIKYVEEFAFSPDGNSFATADRKGNITLRRLEANQVIETLTIEDYGRDITYRPDGKALLGINHQGAVALFDSHTGKRMRQILQPPAHFAEDIGSSPSISLNEEVLITSGQRVFKIWDNEGEEAQVAQTATITYPIRSQIVAMSSDGSAFAAVDNGPYLGISMIDWETSDSESTLVLGDSQSGEMTHILKGESEIHDVAFSRDGEKIVTIHRDRTAQIWSVATGEKQQTLVSPRRINFFDKTVHKSRIGRVAFSDDGTLIVTSDEYAIFVWDALTGKRLHTLNTNSGAGLTEWLQLDGDFAISPDSQWIATSRPPAFPISWRDNRVYVWNAQTGRLARTFIPHTVNPANAGKIRSLAFSPDSSLLAGGDDKNRMTVWQLPDRLSLFSWPK